MMPVLLVEEVLVFTAFVQVVQTRPRVTMIPTQVQMMVHANILLNVMIPLHATTLMDCVWMEFVPIPDVPMPQHVTMMQLPDAVMDRAPTRLHVTIRLHVTTLQVLA
jgi:hypothetical protein